MATLDFTLRIAAPVERVAAFFVPQRMPLWYGPEMDTQFEVQGGAADFAAGQKVRITGKLGQREVAITAVVTCYEWRRALEWRFQDAYGIQGLQRWELEADSGATRLRMREEFEWPSWGRLGNFLRNVVTRWSVASRDRMYLANLKKIAEAA